MAANNEFNTQVAVCNWIKVQLPDVIFRSDLGGIRLTPGLARKAKMIQRDRAYPDLFIAEPVGRYHGLFIEIKGDENDMFNKNGTFKKTEHLFEQATMLMTLNSKGYYADFGIGFHSCCNLITCYISGMLNGPVRGPTIYRDYITQVNSWYYGKLPQLRLRD